MSQPKSINNCFAGSVKNRVHLYWDFVRARGSPRQAIKVWLIIDRDTVLQTHGTVACTGILQTRVDDGGDEKAQKHLVEDRMIYEMLMKYVELSLDEILSSKNPIIRAIGMLDSRLGKHRLSKINVKHEPPLVRRLFWLRCQCEGLPVQHTTHAITTTVQARYTASGEEDEETKSARILTKRKRKPNLQTILDAIEKDGTLSVLNAADGPLPKALLECLKDKRTRTSHVQFLRTLDASSRLVNENYMLGLSELFRDRYCWLRPVEDWKPRSYNAERQFSSLARHFFANYDVPRFMDKAWLTGERAHQAWFRHIGGGGNIRTADKLPVPLTKMMAHHFLTGPDHYSINNAFRWGQARALGADRQLAEAIVQTRLSDDFRDNDFWTSVFSFFARNPMLDIAHVGPIVDYIWNQRYEDAVVFVERGVAETRGPAQPNFTMKGRTAESLLRQVERWHQDLGKRKSGGALSWTKSNIADWEFIEGTSERKNMRIWRIAELLSTAELMEEGRKMRHCVATYAQSCKVGHCSIWSLTVQTNDGVARVLTIEVRQPSNVIRQVRGKLNRLPDQKEREIIQRWATKEGLKYS